MIIVDVKIMKGLWPKYLNVIAAVLTLIFFIVLAMAYLESFIQIKRALTQTTNNQVSVKVQVIYLGLLFLLAII
jgi:hypothetical protein